jgi:hypothetical protein
MNTEVEFRFKDRRLPNRTKSSRRVAYTITTQKKRYLYSNMNVYIGAYVLKLLGWQRGYDRVQFAQHGDYMAVGRQCGQFKLSGRSSGHQAVVTLSAFHFTDTPPERTRMTELAWKIHKQRNGEKVLLIPLH